MNVTNRVTIPNDVADAIESFRGKSYDNAIIAKTTLFTNGDGPKTKALRSIPFDTLLSALINGYEREQTAEERAHDKIRQWYVDKRYTAANGMLTEQVERDTGFANGIFFTLNTLGVKVAGVNG